MQYPDLERRLLAVVVSAIVCNAAIIGLIWQCVDVASAIVCMLIGAIGIGIAITFLATRVAAYALVLYSTERLCDDVTRAIAETDEALLP